MYQNVVYIQLSWYCRICWCLVKNCWIQLNSRCVSRDSHIFLDSPWRRYNCAKFHNCGICVADFQKGKTFLASSPIREKPQKGSFWIGLMLKSFLFRFSMVYKFIQILRWAEKWQLVFSVKFVFRNRKTIYILKFSYFTCYKKFQEIY